MGVDAVKKANEGSVFFLKSNLKRAVHALNRLAMFDMLPALFAVRDIDRDNVSRVAGEVVGNIHRATCFIRVDMLGRPNDIHIKRRLFIWNHSGQGRLSSTRCQIFSVDYIRVVMREHHLIVGIADGVVPSSNCWSEHIQMTI
jgi:hypothetical protein